jgi:hypothetical protein
MVIFRALDEKFVLSTAHAFGRGVHALIRTTSEAEVRTTAVNLVPHDNDNKQWAHPPFKTQYKVISCLAGCP